MSAPFIHSLSSARKFGGKPEDYMAIHKKMDCSKGIIPDNRHRVLTHTMFWIMEVMIPIFGDTFVNSAGKTVSVKDVCEQHILEDFSMKYIPTPQDYIEDMPIADWMNNGIGDPPSSAKKIIEKRKEGKVVISD